MTEPSRDADVLLRNVTKTFGGVMAVQELSLGIPRGVFLSLLGPSGCGKTTTLRLIAGFEAPSQGEIFIRGDCVNRVPPYRRDFSMVFQNFALFPHMTVAENVAFGLRMRRLPRREQAERMREALDLVHLAGYEDRHPRQLSGGQQQRVALARAIVVRPAVLLLDEPLGSLDKKLREQMQVELRQLQQTLRITTVFVTHDQEEALTLSDQVAIMQAGRIEQLGTPRELYERPATDFVANFLGVSNVFEGRLVGGTPDEAVVAVGPLQVPLPWEGALEVGAAVRLAIRPEKIRLVPPEHAGGLPAQVRHVVYLGPLTHFYLDASGGQPLVVHVQNGSPEGAPWRPGDCVHCVWEPGSLFRLPKG
jgi:putative spermidine/putrescine transport system ATP-binding protein/spermidine/putrescine transport system ATP-binding protein